MQQLENLKCLYNEKVPKLYKEVDDAFKFWLASIPTAAEAPEVDLVAEGLVSRDSALPRKVRRLRNSKSRYLQSPHLHSIWTNLMCFFKISSKKLPLAQQSYNYSTGVQELAFINLTFE